MVLRRSFRTGGAPGGGELRRPREHLGAWLGVALLGHAALLAIVPNGLVPSRTVPPSAPSSAPPPSAEDASDWLWLDTAPLIEDPESEKAAAAERLPEAEPERLPPGPMAAARRLETRAERGPRAVAPGGTPVEPASDAVLDPGRGPSRAAEPDAAVASEGPRLSLSDLGVGAENNPFTREVPRQPSERQFFSRRLEDSLGTSLARHDQRLGLGPEGPAVAAVTQIVMESATSPNTSGLLAIHTDADGLTHTVEVLEASNDSQGWLRVAAELKRALAGKKLRVPKGSSGISMQLRVVSRVQLPSGTDPGLAVELFGQTIKKGSGDRSARLKLLSPEITVSEVEIPYTDGHSMPVLGFSPNVIGFSGDIADIGAVARRVVSAHLVALDTHRAVDSPVRAP
jgi:hypothetical protein